MNGKLKMRGVFERPAGSGNWWISYYDRDGVRHRESIGRESAAIEARLQRLGEVERGKYVAPRGARDKTHQMRGVFERPIGSGIWWINYYDADGVRHREKIGRESIAQEAYLQRRIEVKEGKFAAPRITSPQFKQIADERMVAKKPRLAPRSFETDRQRLDRMESEIGTVPLKQLTAKRIEQMLAKFAEQGTGDATVNRYRSLLSSIFTIAIRNKRTTENPMREVARRRESAGRIRFLSVEEERKLRRAIKSGADGRQHIAEFDLALNTGMRRGEQFGLKWEDVDLGRNVLLVSGKTGRRFIQINQAARESIDLLHRAGNGTAYLSPQKKYEVQEDWRRWFEDAVVKAKISDFRWHDLRHTFASRLVMSGIDLSTVQQLLGHKSILTTMRYAHLSQKHRQQAVNVLDRRKKRAQMGTAGTAPALGRSQHSQKVLQMV